MNTKSFRFKDILNIIFGIALLVFLILFVIYDTIYFKTATSICFVCAAIIYFERKSEKSKRFPIALIAGLIACLVGDVTIFYWFEVGAIAFAVGHICYSISYYSICKFRKRELFFTLGIFVFACIVLTFTPFIYMEPAMYPICYGYSLIISFMASKSISNFIEKKDRLTLLICIGSIAFCLSDIMVFYNTFNNVGTGYIYKNIGHFLYFPAQYIIAQAVKHYYKEK